MTRNILLKSVGEPDSTSREQHLLNTLPLISRIAAAKLSGGYRDQVEDVVQTIALNLWRWQRRREEPEMPGINQPNNTVSRLERNDQQERAAEFVTSDELSHESWLKVAATAARNEVSSFYSSKFRREITVEHPELLPVPEQYYDAYACSIEGETEAEVDSLLAHLWCELQTLSLRRRYALLLNKDEFIDELIAGGVCSITELARYFEMERDEFLEIVESLPLADERIAELITAKTAKKTSLKQVWTWRAKAKMKLTQAMTGKIGALLFLIISLTELVELIEL